MNNYSEYLKSIGMSESYAVVDRQCELCGSNEYEILRSNTRINEKQRAYLPVVACRCCSLIFQLPKFSRDFYNDYYQNCYRSITSGSNLPPNGFLDDQIARGNHLLQGLKNWIPPKGNLLDVGCSAGGLMVPFRDDGWSVFGVDPDKAYSTYGSEKFSIPIKCDNAEDMELNENIFDLIIINGSLEHVDDPNLVLSLCARAAKPNSLLLIEGRGLAQMAQIGTFSHNHRRYLNIETASLFMQKFGWNPVMQTEDELCGPTRPQSIFVLGMLNPIKQRPRYFNSQLFSKSDAKGKIESIKQHLDAKGILP